MSKHSPLQPLRITPLEPMNQACHKFPNNKKVAHLIFYGSDEEHESSEEDNHQKLCQTAREHSDKDKAASIHINFTKQSSRMQPTMFRPSFMHSSLQNQVDYHEANGNSIKIVHKKDNFVNPLVAAKEIGNEKEREKGENTQTKQKQSVQTKTKIKQQKKQIANLVPTTLIFEDSQDEENQPTNPQGQINADNNGLLQDKPKLQQKNDKDPISPSPPSQISLLLLNQQTIFRSNYFSKIVNNTAQYQNILQLMFIPLLPGTVQFFQVQVYNSILQKSFELWYSGPSTPIKKCLMKGKKYVRPNKTYYEIVTYLQHCYQHCQTCTIVSNLDRSEFNIELYKNNATFLLGTIASAVTLKNTRNLVLYYPQQDPQTNMPLRIPKTEPYQSLKQIYQEADDHRIRYLITAKLTLEEKLQLMREHKFKVSDKSIEFRNEKEELKLVIGKKASKVYGLIAGSALTPIQAFSLAILNIETS